jgi:hypothetical protein
MTGWTDLIAELDRWAEAGRAAEFWWRDDDAVAVTPALERLSSLQRSTGASVALAVIPARAEMALAQRLAAERGIVPVQHGWAHLNHAPPGRPKAELGPDRPAAYVLGELNRGRLRLDELFGAAWLRVLVPPHNRIAPAIAAGLAAAGYLGLSADKPRRRPLTGLVQINTHVDIMEWTTTRAFVGEPVCLDRAIAHLAAKRQGQADDAEPTGLLTHHLAHDEAAWAFAQEFITRTQAHRIVQWRRPDELFQRKIAAIA